MRISNKIPRNVKLVLQVENVGFTFQEPLPLVF